MCNRYFGDIELTEDQEELADYYADCTNGHAYDEGGRLFGKMVIEVTYNGFANEVQVLSTDIEKIHPDPMDE